MKALDETDYRIIKALCEGKAAKEMDIPGIRTHGIRKRLNKLKEAFFCKNDNQLIAELFSRGIAQEIINLEL